MPDQSSSAKPSGDSADHAFIETVTPPPTPEQNQMGEQPKPCPSKTLDPALSLERDIKKGEIALIIINALLLVTTIIIAKIYYGQLEEMRKATAASRDAANAAADAVREGEKSLQANIDQFHLDQRAWVGITDARSSFKEIGDKLRVEPTIEIRNTGKTPAIRMSWDIISRHEPRGIIQPIDYETASRQVEDQIRKEMRKTEDQFRTREEELKRQFGESSREAQAVATTRIQITMQLEKILAQRHTRREAGVGAPGQVSALRAPVLEVDKSTFDGETVYVWAKITYYDVFQKELHTTKFCGFHNGRDSDSFNACPTGNSMK